MANLTVTDELVAQRDVFGNTLVELIDDEPRTYVLDADLANSTKADIVSKQRPEHFLEMGIAEQNMMGVAAGMACCGLIPWLSSFAVFLVNRDLDQLRVVVAQPNLNVKIGSAYTGLLTGKTGKTQLLDILRFQLNLLTDAVTGLDDLEDRTLVLRHLALAGFDFDLERVVFLVRLHLGEPRFELFQLFAGGLEFTFVLAPPPFQFCQAIGQFLQATLGSRDLGLPTRDFLGVFALGLFEGFQFKIDVLHLEQLLQTFLERHRGLFSGLGIRKGPQKRKVHRRRRTFPVRAVL